MCITLSVILKIENSAIFEVLNSYKLLNKKDGFKKIRYHLSLLANLKYRCYEENFRIIFYFDFVSM